jgi:hypothetical protein
METIIMIRSGRGMDFSRYVERVFRDRESAWKYQNNLDHNVTVRAVDGRWKKGAKLPMNLKTRDLLDDIATNHGGA